MQLASQSLVERREAMSVSRFANAAPSSPTAGATIWAVLRDSRGGGDFGGIRVPVK